MATSEMHKIGQIIGNALELALTPVLSAAAAQRNLYLDVRGDRPARPGKKITWIDLNDNKHDLDFVMEKGGSKTKIGEPAAFIEVAWRRYTKHSKNKAGEIVNALLPLRASFSNTRPFTAAIVAGAWTVGGLTEMTSQSIPVLHFPLESVIKAFATEGIDIDFDEKTPDEYARQQIDKWESLPDSKQKAIGRRLVDANRNRVATFLGQMANHLDRTLTTVRVFPLYGEPQIYSSIPNAINSIKDITDSNTGPLVKIDVQLAYSNGDKIEATFKHQLDAIAFLARQMD